MTNTIMASVIFFYTFFASANDVTCEGIIETSKDNYRIGMVKGTVIQQKHAVGHFWYGETTIKVDISESLRTEYEKNNNRQIQEYNPNSCYGNYFRR